MADSDQEDWVEEAFGQGDDTLANLDGNYQRMTSNNEGLQKQVTNLKKKRQFYYYALTFEVSFDHDDDSVYFAFSQPYPYSQIAANILEMEHKLKPAESSL